MSGMQKVTSSNIAEVGYNSESKVLVVRFIQSNSLYAYYDVPKQIFDELVAASSKGGYFSKSIKDVFTTKLIQESDLIGIFASLKKSTKPKKKFNYEKALKQATSLVNVFPGAAIFF